MNVETRLQDHVIRVQLSGACTIQHAEELQEALLPLTQKTTAVMVELDQITELDCAGLQVLLALRKQCPSMLFCYANGVVQKTLELLNLQQQFHQEDGE